MASGTIQSLVWRVMEVADGMIISVRVYEGGSICDFLFFL